MGVIRLGHLPDDPRHARIAPIGQQPHVVAAVDCLEMSTFGSFSTHIEQRLLQLALLLAIQPIQLAANDGHDELARGQLPMVAH